MAMGFGLLRLSSSDFWQMTPRELERAMSVLAPNGTTAPGKTVLAELMKRFPDKMEDSLG